MIRSLTLSSYAKVNYTLDVLSRRPDGFHNLASVFQAVSLADTITLERADSREVALTCSGESLPGGPENLAWRAADLARSSAGRTDGLQIHLDKRIPIQAGLGGGSSNAATVIRGVNALLELGLTDAQLQEIAAELGSDVPFFLTGGTASARGRGEQLTPLPDGPPLWFVIVKPEAGVSTAWAYAELDAIPNRISARSTRSMEAALAEGDPERIAARMTNDFEQVVFSPGSPITQVHDDLFMARARAARLCGSGSAVFGVAMSEPEANEVARIVRLRYSSVFVCRALTRAESLAPGEAAV